MIPSAPGAGEAPGVLPQPCRLRSWPAQLYGFIVAPMKTQRNIASGSRSRRRFFFGAAGGFVTALLAGYLALPTPAAQADGVLGFLCGREPTPYKTSCWLGKGGCSCVSIPGYKECGTIPACQITIRPF